MWPSSSFQFHSNWFRRDITDVMQYQTGYSSWLFLVELFLFFFLTDSPELFRGAREKLAMQGRNIGLENWKQHSRQGVQGLPYSSSESREKQVREFSSFEGGGDSCEVVLAWLVQSDPTLSLMYRAGQDLNLNPVPIAPALDVKWVIQVHAARWATRDEVLEAVLCMWGNSAS